MPQWWCQKSQHSRSPLLPRRTPPQRPCSRRLHRQPRSQRWPPCSGTCRPHSRLRWSRSVRLQHGAPACRLPKARRRQESEEWANVHLRSSVIAKRMSVARALVACAAGGRARHPLEARIVVADFGRGDHTVDLPGEGLGEPGRNGQGQKETCIHMRHERSSPRNEAPQVDPMSLQEAKKEPLAPSTSESIQ